MRKIKFRAWDKKDNEMLTWPDWKEEICDAIPIDMGDEWTERCEVMQFTGLLDKKGKEIYEGDILSFAVFDYNGNDTQYKGCVVFAEAGWQLWKSPQSEFYGTDGAFQLGWVHPQDEEIEVIGNIYETPELLEEE